jgi:hypothetical protein
MQRAKRTAVAGAILVWLGSAQAAAADPDARPVEPESGPPKEESPVRLRLMIPMWLPLLAMESSVSAAGSEAENLEIESEVSWVVMGLLETGYRPVFARVDVFGVGFGDQVVTRNGEPTRIDFDSSGLIARGVVMLELGPWRLGRSKRYRFALAPLAGARYNDVSFDAGEPSDLSADYAWLDPIVGARTEFLLGDFRVGTHVDFGGFGISSDVAFWASASLEYMITDWFSIWLGWQHYQVLFESSSESREERLRLYLTGPSAGLGLHLF